MTEFLKYLPAALAVMVTLVNIITQVIKGFTYSKIPAQVVTFVVSLTLNIAGMIIFAAFKQISVTWYYVFCSVVAGFVVAYVAMYGYDNLYSELGKAFKNLSEGKNSSRD